jgi:hypothetical protein
LEKNFAVANKCSESRCKITYNKRKLFKAKNDDNLKQKLVCKYVSYLYCRSPSIYVTRNTYATNGRVKFDRRENVQNSSSKDWRKREWKRENGETEN